MIVGHSGDWHVTVGPRFATTRACLEHVVAEGRKAGVQLWTVGGDLTGTEVPHVAAIAEKNLVAEILQAMAETAPVVVCEGNHDAVDDLLIYARLRGRWPIHVATRPETFHVKCPAGPASAVPQRFEYARVYALPYPSKRWFVGAGDAGAIAEQKAAIEREVRSILAAWRLEAQEYLAGGTGVVCLGLMHLNVAGSVTGGGEQLIGREVELSPHDLDELGFPVLLSHIHKWQQMARWAWYAGPPSCQNFGEPDPKGFVLLEVEPEHQVAEASFVETPAVRLVTLEVDAVELIDMLYTQCDLPTDLGGAEVKVRYRVQDEHRDLAPSDDQVKELFTRACGAARVIVDRITIPKTRSRLDDVPIVIPADAHGPAETQPASDVWRAASTPEEKVRVWFATLGEQAPPPEQQERVLARIEALRTGGV